MIPRWAAIGLALSFFSCWSRGSADERILFDPASGIGSAVRMDFAGHNEFVVEQSEGKGVLRSTPHASASGLYASVDLPARSLAAISWRWRVDQLQPHADMRKLESEDAGAVVFFIFGEPSMFNREVPTIGYMWSTTPVANGSVVQSRRFAELRYVQLRGRDDAGNWRTERRNVAEDFRKIFGQEPPPLRKVAIFNDNDQTKEPTSALFATIAASREPQ